MGFKEVASLDADKVVSVGKRDKKTGKLGPKFVEGYYLGNRTVQNKRGDSKLHFLQTPEGNLGVWGTTDMNRKLGQVTPGAMIRITSTGTKPTPNGDMYIYKVEEDSDNSIEVGNLSEGYEAASDDSGDVDTATDSDDNDGGYDGATDEPDYEEAAPAVQAKSAASRKAEVEALLKGKKTAK